MELRIFKNIGANWLGLVSHMVVGLFLTPFILHRLGATGFGIWVVMVAFTGYYGLLDLGMRSAIIRYVARFNANRERDNLARLVCTSLASYSAGALVLLVLTPVVALHLDSLFQLPPEWSQTAKLLLLVFGVGTAAALPLNLFGGILEGFQRFTWINGVQVVAVLVRAGLIVVALNRGYGLLAVGSITIATNLLSYVLYVPMVFRLCPELKLRWSYVERSTLRMLASFGMVTFWIGIAQTLRFNMDAVVIGSFLSLQAVSYFAIGSKIVSYVTSIVQGVATVFTPISSHFYATRDMEQLGRVLVVGNRYSSLVMFPLAAVLIILGKSIIRVWVGPQYLASYPILLILTIPTTLYLAQATSTKILFGMARHRTLAWVLFLEGVSNLILSIVLLKWYGIVGVAVGTAIPLACTSLFFLPRHLCRLLGLRLGRYLREAYLYPLLLTIPLVGVLVIVDGWIQAETYASLLLELSLGGIAYGLGLVLYFSRKEQPERLHTAHWAETLERSSSS